MVPIRTYTDWNKRSSDQEDVYEEMKKDSYWSEYTIEQCQQDLASLVEWKNLNTM